MPPGIWSCMRSTAFDKDKTLEVLKVEIEKELVI